MFWKMFWKLMRIGCIFVIGWIVGMAILVFVITN